MLRRPPVCICLAAGCSGDVTVPLLCAELLYGDRDGVFIFEKQAKITTKTADGVVSARMHRRMRLSSFAQQPRMALRFRCRSSACKVVVPCCLPAGVWLDQQVQGLQGGAGGVGILQGRQVRPEGQRQPGRQGAAHQQQQTFALWVAAQIYGAVSLRCASIAPEPCCAKGKAGPGVCDSATNIHISRL